MEKSKVKIFYLLRGLDCAGWYGINIAAATQLIINLVTLITGTKVNTIFYLIIFITLLIINAIIAQSATKLDKLLTLTLLIMAIGIFFVLLNMGSTGINAASALTNSHSLNFRDIIGNICVVAAYWNGFALNMFDFGRNAKDRKTAFWGNCSGIVIGMLAMAVIAAIFSVQAYLTTGNYNWNLSRSLLYLSTNLPAHLLVVTVFLMFMIATNAVANYYPAIQCIKAIRHNNHIKVNAGIFLVISSAITPFFISSTTSEIAYYWINLCGTVLAPLLAILICYLILKNSGLITVYQYRWIYLIWTSLYIGVELFTLTILSYLWLVSIIGIFVTVYFIYQINKNKLSLDKLAS